MDITYFHHIDADTLAKHTGVRAGETKLGQVIKCGEAIETTKAKFIVIGIAESIGVKGNDGVAGTHTAWEAFLPKFLNIQLTKKLDADQIMLLGMFNFQALYDDCEDLAAYRKASEKVDELVYPVIQQIVSAGKTPIIIGGSHANAYPIIKGSSLGLDKPLAVINLDAHADFRALEGRHSGNPFSYAFADKYLAKYAVIGLHENYNSQNMLDEMTKHEVLSVSWEEIYLRKTLTLSEALANYRNAFASYPCGIELDLDAIEHTLSSAMGPSGFTVTEARQYAHQSAKHPHPCYLHLCEGSAKLASGQKSDSMGKLLTYLATDFIKSYIEKTA